MSTSTTTPIATVQSPRKVERLVAGQATSDGAGVKLTRVLTQELQHRLDPYLMLDAFGTDNPGDYIGGFPDHPHRGFETVTYMIAGRMRHRDSGGNEGLLSNGGVQWMTAGRGVIHSEMPEQEDGRMEGFQLWLNLPAKDKMRPAWYRDIPTDAIPEARLPGATVRVIAGASHGVAGAMRREDTEPLYLDIHLEPGARFEQPLPAAHNANSLLYEYAPQIMSAIRKRGDEVVAHGRTNAENLRGLWQPDEERILREVTDTIARHEGAPPAGWMGSGAYESAHTPDLLKESGFTHLLDWPIDDQPMWMKTRAGPILSVPGMTDALRDARAPVVAVSPIVGGSVLKGPTAEFMTWAGLPLNAAGIARAYAGIVDGVLADEDQGGAGVALRVADTMMADAVGRRAVAQSALDLALELEA